MSYKVLYRKYRPHDFNYLYGQDNIKTILIESIIKNKISHAYIFSGPRGTGKTSTAKLFAKAINCENPNSGIPCDACTSCKNYDESPDIIEIDAASNNGVDEIRDLRDNVKILPTFSKYKIYIIDEVHMLSQSAWNAFLKTLEEPPKHVIFILATTEIQKIPITVISRCQRFNFSKITDEVIGENIKRISTEEKIDIDDAAIKCISELADGSMRDALSILDQLSNESTIINEEMIESTFGLIKENEIKKIFEGLVSGDIIQINEIFENFSQQGIDCNLLINKIISFLYTDALNYITNQNSIMNNPEITKKIAFDLTNCYFKKDALNLIKITIISYFNPSKYEEKIISREIICNLQEDTDKSIKNNLSSNTEENKPKDKIIVNDYQQEIIECRINNSFCSANKTLKQEFTKNWQEFVKKIRLDKNVDLLPILEDTNVEVVAELNVLLSNESISTSILFNAKLDEIELAFNTFAKSSYKFVCIDNNRWEQEKKKYIKNKNNYKYIDEPNMSLKKADEKIVISAKEIFDQDIIEIN